MLFTDFLRNRSTTWLSAMTALLVGGTRSSRTRSLTTQSAVEGIYRGEWFMTHPLFNPGMWLAKILLYSTIAIFIVEVTL